MATIGVTIDPTQQEVILSIRRNEDGKITITAEVKEKQPEIETKTETEM